MENLSIQYDRDFNLMVFSAFILGGFFAVNLHDQYSFLLFVIAFVGATISIIRTKLVGKFYENPNDMIKHWVSVFEAVQYAAILSFGICLLFVGA